jgi:DNA-binding MarR family transcriptional regulator
MLRKWLIVGYHLTMSAKDLRFYSRLQLAAHALKKESDRRLLDVAGVTTAQWSALNFVSSAEAVTQTSLAKELGLNDSAITAMVRRLIDLNFLERVRDENDGRAWLLNLSALGFAAIEKTKSITDGTSSRVDELLGKNTIATVVAALELIIIDAEDR